jgi:hypothetical protein
MEGADALSRLARASGLQVKKVGANSYVLAAAPKPRTVPPRPRPVARIVPAAVQVPVEPEPQDIVVTASKRDTLSRRFPGQWTRLDGADFAPLGVAGSEAIESRSVGFS